MDLTRTRTALHGAAELLLAGPQYATSGTIELRVVPGGLATVAAPDLQLQAGVQGAELVSDRGRHRLSGSYAEVAAAAGITPRRLDDVYGDGPGVGADDLIALDPAALAVLVEAFETGDAALRAFAPDQVPVLWPEHFDVALERDEVNYGVSPGDSHLAEPYAYVGPWTPRAGSFWNQPFGAARPIAGFGGVEAVVEFFAEGAHRALTDPVAG